MRSRIIIRLALLAAVLVVAACQDMNPYTRSDTWQPTGANAGNIAAMVANPYDLIRGRGVDKVDSEASNVAIGHIWNDKPKALLDPGGGSGGGSGSSGGGGGGGAPGSGG
jgi:uncharacterized membrane protein YgcG